MPRPAAERDAGAAAQSPEQAAHEAEHVAQRQQAQQRVLRRERQLCRAVPRALAQAVVGQHHGLRALGRPGGEEEDPAGSVLHAAHQRQIEFFPEVLVAPEQIHVRIADQRFEQLAVQRRVEQHELQPGEVRGEELDDVLHAAVAQQTEAAFPALPQRGGAFGDARVKRGEGERFLFITQGGGVRGLGGEMREQMLEAVKAHRRSLQILFFPIYHSSFRKESLLSALAGVFSALFSAFFEIL